MHRRLHDAKSPRTRATPATHGSSRRRVRLLISSAAEARLVCRPRERERRVVMYKRRFTYGSIRMARFSLLEQLLRSDSGFADFLASLTGGSSGHDHLNGTTGGNFLFAGGGNDAVAGMAGNDMLNGGSG